MTSDTSKPCWECVRKRRVCDFARPLCGKCETRGIICPGYDQKPLKWLLPGQTRSKGRRANRKAVLVVPDRVPHTLPRSIRFPGAEPLEAAVYYNSVISPDLEALGIASERSLFLVQLDNIAYMPQAFIETMICTTLGHRLLQYEHAVSSKGSITIGRRLQRHRGNAIKCLADMIANPASQYKDLTLVSTITFLLSEIQQSISPTWSDHSDGAHLLMHAQGGMRTVILSKPHILHLLRYLILIDIFGATTTPNPSLEKTFRQMAIIDLLGPIYGSGLATSIPCDHKLLRLLVLINHQRALNLVECPTAEDAFSSMLEILDQITAFSVADWVRDISVAQSQYIEGGINTTKSAAGPQETWNWAPVGKAYQSAISLYCINSLTNIDEVAREDDTERYTRLSEIQLRMESCRGALLCSLTQLVADPVPQLRKLVFWPVFIAGVVCKEDEGGTRNFVRNELLYISRALGTAAALVARDFLDTKWHSITQTNCQTWPTWDHLFDRSYIFAV